VGDAQHQGSSVALSAAMVNASTLALFAFPVPMFGYTPGYEALHEQTDN
jgi:hypothetical protein